VFPRSRIFSPLIGFFLAENRKYANGTVSNIVSDVNIAYVAEIDQTPKGDGSAKLKCGHVVDLSRRYMPLLMGKLAN
jgi:hypothetical protein